MIFIREYPKGIKDMKKREGNHLMSFFATLRVLRGQIFI
jgi:hypothetical protein